MSESNKRQAQSPLAGDEDYLKRRIIMEDLPLVISLDDTCNEETAPLPDGGAELASILENDNKVKPKSDRPADEKVDCLIDRMDNFMKCFAALHSTVIKNQHGNERKLKCLEAAHNDLVGKVVKSAESTESRIESLEAKLEESLSANTELADKVARLEGEQDRRAGLQRLVNEDNSKKINALEIDLGFTNRNMYDCRSEVKERKMIIVGVAESSGENVKIAALNCINTVIEAAMIHSIDDKEMVFGAKSDLKDDQNIKYFFNDDISNDGRVLKTKLKRIAQVANSQGRTAKVSGNKVTIDSRSYFSNELSMIPPEVAGGTKHEKEIEGGIIYKGEKSIFSNFFPAPFTFNGIDFLHVEQYFQHCKAIHHREFQTADRILRLSSPRRIKTVGDGIEENAAWLETRMMTLYHGVKAKFEQNWSLQDELTSTKGKQLYEATTDPYFACGIGYESKRWADHDWSGENVAGLIVMKVRDELLCQVPVSQSSNNTLGEIATEEHHDASVTMDCHSQSLDDIVAEANVSTSTVIEQTSAKDHHKGRLDVENATQTSHPLNNTPHPLNSTPGNSWGPNHSQRGRGHNRRGRGRGRGRGGKAHQSQRNTQPKRPHLSLNESDRSFLQGSAPPNNKRQSTSATNSQSQSMNWASALGLSAAQIKGLEIMGIVPNQA